MNSERSTTGCHEILSTPESVGEYGPGRQRDRLLAVLCGSTLLMVLFSSPLWLDSNDYPAVPWFARFPSSGLFASWVRLALIVSGLGLGMARGWGRVGSMGAAIGLTWALLGDQLRLQAWVYQFLVMSTAIACLPRLGLGFCRLFFASMHLYSGLSKLDISFVREMGPRFLRGLSQAVGVEPGWILRGGPSSLLLLMPAFEILAAILLLRRSTLKFGLAGVVLIHGLLLIILGPGGLGHSIIVLIWNAAMIVEGVMLFGGGERDPTGVRPSILVILSRAPCGLILILPLTERAGWFDSWPSHALYASHIAHSQIAIEGDVTVRLPEGLRGAFLGPAGIAPRPIDLTAWTVATRGVPPYPHPRYANGVAEWLGMRLDRPGIVVSIDHAGIADRWTGERALKSLRGLESIRREGDRYRFNAHPRPPAAP